LTERYFTELPGRLIAAGHRVTILPWLFNHSGSLVDAYRTLRRVRHPDCLIIEDHVRPADYFRAAIVVLRAAVLVGRVGDFGDYGTRFLARRERWLVLRSGELVRHVAVGYGLERWLRNGGDCDVWVDMFENMPPERPPIAAFRRLRPKALLLGYIHTLTTKEFLGYQFDPGEWLSPWLPDRVVVNGPLAAEVYWEQGVPADRLKTGPALRLAAQLRRLPSSEPPIPPSGRRNLLIVLPMTADAAAELAVSVFDAMESIADLRPRVFLKKHPMCARAALETLCGVLRAPPESWSWEDRELSQCLRDMDVCAVGMTGAVLDIALSGTPLVYVQRAVEAEGDYSKLLGTESRMTRGVTRAELGSRLRELLLDKTTAVSEAQAIAQRLQEGLAPVSPATLSVFLPGGDDDSN
jgi:hypothetical protein